MRCSLGSSLPSFPPIPALGRGGFVGVAAADGGDAEVEVGVLGVAALVDEVFGGEVLAVDLDDLLIGRVVFTEVSAESALAVVNSEHRDLLTLRGLRFSVRPSR